MRTALFVGAVLAAVSTGTFEVLRAARFESAFAAMFPQSADGILMTGWWTIVAGALLPPRFWRKPEGAILATALAVAALVKLLIVDTLAFAVTGHWSDLAGVAFNRQMVVGAMTIAVGFGVHFLYKERLKRDSNRPSMRRSTIWFTVLLVACVWLGTFEICRVFRFEPLTATLPDRSHAMQVALSVFWSLFAAGLITFGFIRRAPVMRYFALALFLLTLVKVTLFDLRHLDVAYRIMCAIALGGLLLFASLVYQRMSTKLEAKAS